MTNLFLLIIPLVGGYLFLSILNLTKYKIIRTAGYRLFFLSAFVGIVLLIIAKIIIKFLLTFNIMNLIISIISEWTIPTGLELESMTALFVGVGLSFLLNLILRIRFGKHEFAKVAAKDRGESLHLMIYEAIENKQPIELTMQNEKVYIGLVSITGDFFNECVIVTPYFSGYRDEKTNDLVITNNYKGVLTEMRNKENSSMIEIEHSDLNVTLKMSDVATAQIFYPEVYIELERLSRRSIT